MTQKTSPYVFPFRPFRHLDRTDCSSSLTEPRCISRSEIQALIDRLAPPIALPPGETLEDRLLALFLDPSVVFGDPDFVLSKGEEWKEGFRRSIMAGKPLTFSILGFPFKAPVPLKTDRKLPDFGELVMLALLDRIAASIAAEYLPGLKIHVFAEGAFASMSGMPAEDATAYFEALNRLTARFGFSRHLVLHDLAEVAKKTPHFAETWHAVTEEIRERRDRGDEKTVTALRDSLPVEFHLIACPGVDLDLLRRAYLNDTSNDSLAQKLRSTIQAEAEQGVLEYRAFLEARDRTGMIELIAPDALGLTVSPRPGRLGVRPLPPPADVLPYHGVPVWNPDQGTLSIEYLWDLLNSGRTYQPLLLEDDPEPKPFLYVEK